MALATGDPVPQFTLVRGHEDTLTSSELWAGGPTVVLYYVFDWSGTEGG